jgi:hypothetical protein
MKHYVTFVLSAIALLPTSGLSWNSYGHMAVACIAYGLFTPQTRAKADALFN